MPALRFRVKICLNLPLKFSVVLRQTGCFLRKSFFKTLITLEPEVLHRPDASQNDHKSKGYLPIKNRIKTTGIGLFLGFSFMTLWDGVDYLYTAFKTADMFCTTVCNTK